MAVTMRWRFDTLLNTETFDFYVAADGSDSNAGTLAEPWQTLTKVNSTLAAGETVGLKRGDTFRGPTLVVPGAGVTYGAYGSGAKPVVTGANVLSGAWTADSASGSITDHNSAAGSDDGYFYLSGSDIFPSYNDLQIGNNGGLEGAFLRFTLAVDQGATIDSATLDLTASANATGTLAVSIRAVDADDAAAPTTGAGAAGLTLTTASETWNVPNFTSATVYTSADFASVLQEIVDRPGWVNGNHVVIVLTTTTAAADVIRTFRAFEHPTASVRPKLDVGYTSGSSEIWYKGSITADPIVLVHDGVIGDGTVGRAPRKASKAALAADWDYFYDGDTDRLYVRNAVEPSSTGEVIEYGVREACIDYHGYADVTVQDIQFQHNRGAIVLGVWSGGSAVERFNVTRCTFKEIAQLAVQYHNGYGDFTHNSATDWGLNGVYGGYLVQSIAGTDLHVPVGVTCNDNTVTQTIDRGDLDMMVFLADQWGWLRECSRNTMTLNGLMADGAILVWFPSELCDEIVIEDNVIDSPGGEAIGVQDLHEHVTGDIDVRIRRNFIKDAVLRDDVDREAIRLRGYASGTTVDVSYNVVARTFDGTNTHECIGIEDCTGTTTIYNNTLVGGDEGIKIKSADTSSGISVKNNIIKDCRGAATDNGSYSFVVNDYNCIHGNGSVGETQGANSITGDPLFTDAGNDDYTLQAGSPCIGAGEGGVDIGALPTEPPPTAGLVEVVDGGYQITDAEYQRLYGPGTLVMDYVANHHAGTNYGGTEQLCSHRFRAPYSGYVDKIKVALPNGTDYTGGTGGTMRVRIFPDDGTADHEPDMSGSALGSATRVLDRGGADGSGYLYPELTMSRDTELVAGNVYHIVYDNTDGTPATNYYSVEHACSDSFNGNGTRWLSPIDWGALRGTRTPYGSGTRNWIETTIVPYVSGDDDDYRTPILKVTMAGGEIFGNTDEDSGNASQARRWVASNSAPVRERFIPGSNKTVIGISVMTTALVTGDLLAELTNSGGSVLASATIPAGTLGSNPSGVAALTWRDALLDVPVDMTASSTYYLRFTPQGSSTWLFAGEQNGAASGFAWPTAFTESRAEHFHSGSWKGFYHYNHADNDSGTNSNWRVVLHTNIMAYTELWVEPPTPTSGGTGYYDAIGGGVHQLNNDSDVYPYFRSVAQLETGKTYKLAFDFTRTGTYSTFQIDVREWNANTHIHVSMPLSDGASTAGHHEFEFTMSANDYIYFTLPNNNVSARYSNISLWDVATET